jgi:hypothetical protein
MFREENDLAYVLRDVRERAVHGCHRGERLSADVDDSREVRWAERGEGIDQCRPSSIPRGHDGGATRLGDDELAVTIAIRFLAVGGEKVRPPRAQIPSHVLNDDGDAVRLGVEDPKKVGVVDLGKCTFGELFLAAEREQRIVEYDRIEGVWGHRSFRGAAVTAKGVRRVDMISTSAISRDVVPERDLRAS